MNLEVCLPPDLRGPETRITRVAAGLSGAGVYRIDANGRSFVLKIARQTEPLDNWRRKTHIQQLASFAGLAPAVIHLDEERRAVVSTFVVDRSFPAYFRDPVTHNAALTLLGKTLRRVHDLTLPPDAVAGDPREHLATIWSELATNFALPVFAGEAVERVLAEKAPPRHRATVLSHNDVNPSNLVYDGENLLLLDWETAAPNDPFYDLAAISVFSRMDEGTCLKMLAAYDGEPVPALPPGFSYNRRLVAVLCGTVFLRLARQNGHAGATGGETLDSMLSLGAFFQRLQSGSVSAATADGQWKFGMALLKEGDAL